jgi:sugar phosphate isomerase/epimerase
MTYAEKENIYILLEHTTMLEGNMVVTLHDLQSLLTAIGSHYLLPLIDTGHVFVNGESITGYVLNLKSSVRHIHVDDNDGCSDDHLPPGDGMFDFDPLFHNLMKIGYEGYLSVEPSFAFSSDHDSAALKGLKFINEYVKRITGSQ